MRWTRVWACMLCRGDRGREPPAAWKRLDTTRQGGRRRNEQQPARSSSGQPKRNTVSLLLGGACTRSEWPKETSLPKTLLPVTLSPLQQAVGRHVQQQQR